MADVTATRAAHAAGLACRERWEVVVVDVALGRVRADRVDQLVHPRHTEGGGVQDLRESPLEESRAVCGRDDADLGVERPDVGRRAAVDADAVLDYPLADELF